MVPRFCNSGLRIQQYVHTLCNIYRIQIVACSIHYGEVRIQSSDVSNFPHMLPLWIYPLMDKSTGCVRETFMKHPITEPASSTTPVTTTGKSTGPRRRSKFSREKDLVLLREVAACREHIPPTVGTGELFELAASKANATKKLSSTVSWKALQDRCKLLQFRFDKNDRNKREITGIGTNSLRLMWFSRLWRRTEPSSCQKKNSRKER